MNQDLRSFTERYHNSLCTDAYDFLGCHAEVRDGIPGYVFRLWAPKAKAVSVVGDFNFWNPQDLPMENLSNGIWEAWSANAKNGQAYKFYVTRPNGTPIYKADPLAFRTCRQPDTSSMICDLSSFSWHDRAYFARAGSRDPLHSPMNIYELHLGSWQRKKDGSVYSYSELAPLLASYVKTMGYTHVELMPLTEYPHDPSWGYQVTGYFAPTSRYGSPEELMTLIDTLHQSDIGVILDWVPAHFPKDEHGLCEFDGSCCYELSDPEMNEHPHWTTRLFDFGKPEVKNFLLSSAVYWLDKFHVDGLRVDAVSTMLYLDFGRTKFKPNRYGGRENLEAIEFLRQLNTTAKSIRKGVFTAAEEATAYPLVTRPASEGGLDFTMKWNMGWSHDTLRYMAEDPIYRSSQHNSLTFSLTYAFNESHILPLCHDDVVGGKHSLISKMPGEYDWKFANLRTLLGYQMAHPGKKLMFMGGEFAQFIEWNYRQGLDWLLMDYERHRQMLSFVRDLNHFYLEHDPLWRIDDSWDGFQWIQPDDRDNSVLAFRRKNGRGKEIVCIFNFTPVTREHYRLGLGKDAIYRCVLSSDDSRYGGTGVKLPDVAAESQPFREYAFSGSFTLPPMSVTFYSVES